MGQVNIIRINATDYKEVNLLNQELGHSYPIEKVRVRIEHIIENTNDIILVAEKGDEVIGYIHGSPYELLYSDSLLNVLGFVVKEKFRNIGIGNMLLANLEAWAKENNYCGIRLVSGIERLNAHRFYLNHGYTNRKDQKNFIKIFQK